MTVCTDAFVGLAREESKNLGLPDLPLAVIRHPLGGEPAEEIVRRAREALPQVVQGLTGEPD